MINNLLVIGGPISVGKSTLVNSINFNKVHELNDSDEIQMKLLEYTYNKGRVAPEVIEFYFLELRRIKYLEHAKDNKPWVLDRSIFESLIFAKEKMNSKSFQYFKKLWENQILNLIKEVGKPKLYLLLSMSWETFMNRLFKRGREVETNNFNENKKFFEEHIMEYEKHMISVFEKFKLNYKIIKTDNLNSDEVYDLAEEYIKEAYDEKG